MFDKVTKKLEDYDLEALEVETGFKKRSNKKVTARSFVEGLWETFHKGGYSLNAWALAVSMRIKKPLSESGLQKNISYRHEAFGKALFEEVTSRESQMSPHMKHVSTALFKDFERVLLEDSTCLNLALNLADEIKGSHSNTGKAATAKVQLLMDLKTDSYLSQKVGCFRDSDGKHSPEILKILAEKDLVIRDLGYWSIDVFIEIKQLGASFLSPLKKRVNIYNESGKRLNLVELLKNEVSIGSNKLSMTIRIGAKKKFKTRLVAIRLPPKQAQEERRKAKKNRDKRMTCTKEKLFLAEWKIYVTNVSEQIWDEKQVSQAYGFRWRIEIVFKCWKSKLGLAKMFVKTSMSPPYAMIVIYLALSWITLAFMDSYRYYYSKVFDKYGIRISMMQFAAFFKENHQLLWKEDSEILLVNIAQRCKYDKRKDRLNHEEKLVLY